MSGESPKSPWWDHWFWGGASVAAVLALLVPTLLWMSSIAGVNGDWFLLLLFLIGLTQAIYVVPMHEAARRRDRTNFAAGVRVGAAVTAAVNVLVVLVVWWNWRGV